ncbi:non-ribosomal peptide synthetase [Actinoplanes sp. NPDC049316]|uniref:non-ribosomal peptide synthetase n=1 Tax=Actinoplanes sp. NPDC049316 TaxID=3154727 RepID=UPI0034400378
MAEECVGPVATPDGLMRSLHDLAGAVGTDGLAALAVCAWVLAPRLSRDGATTAVRLIQGPREIVTPTAPPPAGSFRAALRRAAELTVVTGPDPRREQPVEATILVSQDGRRLYAENMTSSADTPTALCWARSFVELLTRLTGEPDAPMHRHPLIGDAERERILHGLNAYQRPEVRHRTMTEPFEEQVRRSPGAIALLDEEGVTLTYRELNERANRLAHFLRAQGAGAGTRVGICMERGIEQIVAIYAAAKAGAAYVPLDAELPDARLAYIAEDAAPRLVLTDPACRARVPAGGWRIVDTGREPAPWAGHPATDPAVDSSAEDLVHILYTSGTTGRPKGVAYPRSAALANIAWNQRHYPFGPGDSAVFKTSPGFDVSIWEIFWPLYHGARLVVCRPGAHRDLRHLAALVGEHRVTTIFLSPTVMAPFLEHVSARRTGSLKWAWCGGEPMTRRIWRTFYDRLPESALINCYGPTEGNNVTDLVLAPVPEATVPLGRPAANFRITLLDENLGLVPVGMPGEVYLGGEVGLAHAYWRKPGLSAERFVADPYGPPGARMYRTGDLCRYRPDGVLEHLGRIDRQVKIRGLRIEPGEIESVLTAHPAVADCAVVAHGTPARLLAFVVGAEGPPDTGAVAEHAAAHLPAHMCPESLVVVPRIPYTVNGKVDQVSLVDTWRREGGGKREIVPPADELEAAVVDIYRRVLQAGEVSVDDTFAQLGGHSVLAFKVLDECAATLGSRPDPARVLGGTVSEVAASIRAGRRGLDRAGDRARRAS